MARYGIYYRNILVAQYYIRSLSKGEGVIFVRLEYHLLQSGEYPDMNQMGSSDIITLSRAAFNHPFIMEECLLLN